MRDSLDGMSVSFMNEAYKIMMWTLALHLGFFYGIVVFVCFQTMHIKVELENIL